MSAGSDRRFANYKPLKLNGVFVPELATHPVTIPPLATTFARTAVLSTPSSEAKESDTRSESGEGGASTPSSIQKIIDSIRSQQRRMKCLSMNLAHLKSKDGKEARDQGASVRRINSSFCEPRNRTKEFPQPAAVRTHTETEEKDPANKIPKTNSVKYFSRTRTVAQPEEFRFIKEKAAAMEVAAKALQFDDPSPESKEEINELTETNLVLKEIVKKIWEKYQHEKRRSARLAEREEALARVKFEMKGIRRENAALHKQNGKLKTKLEQCLDFFNKFADVRDEGFLEDDTLISQLYEENKYLREALMAPQSQPSPETKDKGSKKEKTKAKRHRRGRSSGVESESEEEEPTNRAIKLLTIKYCFEKSRRILERRKRGNVEGGTHEQLSMQDKIKQFGNLKPKQQFIMMQEDSKEGEAESGKGKEPDKKGGDVLIVDELSSGNLKRKDEVVKEEEKTDDQLDRR